MQPGSSSPQCQLFQSCLPVNSSIARIHKPKGASQARHQTETLIRMHGTVLDRKAHFFTQFQSLISRVSCDGGNFHSQLDLSRSVSAIISTSSFGFSLAGCRSRSSSAEIEKWLAPVPVHIVTEASQLPAAFLEPDEKQPLIIGFDCEGVNLARYGRLCIMQLAFEDAVYLVDAVEGGNTLMQACKPGLESTIITKVVHDCKRDSEALYFQYGIKLHNAFDTQIGYALIEEQQGKTWAPDNYISFVGLLAHERYCGVVYDEKEEVRGLLKQDPQFWTHRPWTEMMTRVAADDVRFLLCIYEKMMEKLDNYSLWQLHVRGCLYCRCFCDIGDDFPGWPSPRSFSEFANSGEETAHQEEVLAVVDVIPGRMGRIIGKKGSSILSIKQSCRTAIFMGGAKGPPDKVFVIGDLKEVRKAEAILRGRML